MMKDTLDDQIIAFTAERAATLVGVSEDTLRRWAEEGVVGASLVRHISARNVVRLYDIRDLEALLVVAQLQDHFCHQRLRKLVRRLRHQYPSPLSELHWGVGDQVYFRHPDGTWEGDRRPDQTVLRGVIDLTEIRARIREHARATRPADERGRIVKTRKVLGSKPTFAGTRVPVSAVAEFLAGGADADEILAAFPRLTHADIDAVRRELAAS